MPGSSPQTVIAAAGRRLEEFAAQRQIKLAPFAESVGLDVADFSRFGARVNLEAFMRLLHLLEIVSSDDCFGLRYAQFFQQGDSGAFGFAILNAPTLREALRIYGTYQPLVADSSLFEMAEDGSDTTIRWRYSRLIDYPHQYSDFRAGLLVKVLRGFLGEDWTPRRTELMRGRPKDGALHRSFFGSALSFETAHNAIWFPAAVLDTRSGTDDPRLFEMMEASCQQALQALGPGRDLRLQAAEQIVHLLPEGEANLTSVARALGLGERSLQRRLGELETSFEKLVEQTRRDLSDRLLAGDTPLAEISYLCGYSNASAYSRAARAWYGMAPQAMRQQLRDRKT